MLPELPTDALCKIMEKCSCRDVLALSCTCRSLCEALKDDLLWRQLAESKWGRHVQPLAQVEPGGWATWVRHRLSISSHPVSPLNLVQERYQEDPFQHLVACVCCSRTSGGPAVRDAIRSLLDIWPTPSAIIDAQDDSLVEVLNPLGLQAVRLDAVRCIAHGFLATDWQDPSEFKHCGKFVSDSYAVFCRGRLSPDGIEDKSLQRYLHWRATGRLEEAGKQRQKGAAGGGRKRQAEAPVEAGTLRSGRRRGDAAAEKGDEAAAQQEQPASERRQTRAAAAAGGRNGREAAARRGQPAAERRQTRAGAVAAGAASYGWSAPNSTSPALLRRRR